MPAIWSCRHRRRPGRSHFLLHRLMCRCRRHRTGNRCRHPHRWCCFPSCRRVDYRMHSQSRWAMHFRITEHSPQSPHPVPLDRGKFPMSLHHHCPILLPRWHPQDHRQHRNLVLRLHAWCQRHSDHPNCSCQRCRRSGSRQRFQKRQSGSSWAAARHSQLPRRRT